MDWSLADEEYVPPPPSLNVQSHGGATQQKRPRNRTKTLAVLFHSYIVTSVQLYVINILHFGVEACTENKMLVIWYKTAIEVI